MNQASDFTPFIMIVKDSLNKDITIQTVTDDTVEFKIDDCLIMYISKENLPVYAKMFNQFYDVVFK